MQSRPDPPWEAGVGRELHALLALVELAVVYAHLAALGGILHSAG